MWQEFLWEEILERVYALKSKFIAILLYHFVPGCYEYLDVSRNITKENDRSFCSIFLQSEADDLGMTISLKGLGDCIKPHKI